LVFAIGSTPADFFGGEGNARADLTAKAQGPLGLESSSIEAGGWSGGSNYRHFIFVFVAHWEKAFY